MAIEPALRLQVIVRVADASLVDKDRISTHGITLCVHDFSVKYRRELRATEETEPPPQHRERLGGREQRERDFRGQHVRRGDPHREDRELREPARPARRSSE